MSLADEFDSVAGTVPAPSAQAPQSLVDQFDDAARAADTATASSAPVQPSSKGDRMLTGLGDVGYKTAQFISHTMPEGGLNAINSFNKWVSDKTGLEYAPWQSVDKRVNDREMTYDAQRKAAGSDGFDWMRLFGNAVHPINYALPQLGAETTLARVLGGAAQGAGTSMLSTPTTGDDQQNFWGSQARLGGWGAMGGGVGTVGAEVIAPVVSKGATYLRSLLNTGGRSVAPEAEQITAQALKDKGIDPADVHPGVLGWFKSQVADSLKSGNPPDKVTAANMAEASALPVPVPLLRGQASRDPMQYAKEQNLRGIQGVGEPITDVLGRQNKALIANLDAMGAKGAPNIVDAGQAAIDHIRKMDGLARSNVSAAYDDFKNSAGRSLDVPLQGVAQDYARVAHDYGMDTIPQGVRNHLNSLGLLDGKQAKVFGVEDAENLLKVINKNYDPSNRPAAAALDEIRRSVQGAIVNGTDSDAAGTEAAQLAAKARGLAAQRFKLIDSLPAYKAAIMDNAQPDKFIQKHFWNGNAAEISGMKHLLSADPQALATVKGAIMGDLKQSALNNQSPENGIFSAAKFNGITRDQNNAKRFAAMFEPKEVQALNSLGNVAETALLAPKAAAVNTSNTTSAAANLIQGAVKGGLATQGLSHVGGMDIPIASWAARGLAGRNGEKSLASLVRQATQPLSASDLDAVNFLTKRSGTLGGMTAGEAQK